MPHSMGCGSVTATVLTSVETAPSLSVPEGTDGSRTQPTGTGRAASQSPFAWGLEGDLGPQRPGRKAGRLSGRTPCSPLCLPVVWVVWHVDQGQGS